MKKLLIFPCNGNAIEALSCIGEDYELIGFIDDDVNKQGTKCFGFDVLSREALAQFPDAYVLAVPGNPDNFRNRDKIISELGVSTDRFAKVIHDLAEVADIASVGHNVLIMAGVVITSNATIGNHVAVLPNSVIHHDSSVGEYTLIGANITISGYITIGAKCYVGSGSRIINGSTIGSGAMIGMGSNIIRDVPEGSKVVGNPGRLLS